MAANRAICSGVSDSGRAAAAGMIRKAMVSSTPTILMAIATTSASTSTKMSLTRSTWVPSAAARSSCTRERQQRPPYVHQGRQRQRAAHIDPFEVVGADGEDVAEQEGHQVDLGTTHQRRRDNADGERRMRQQAQQGIERNELLAAQRHEQHGDRQRHDQHAGRQVEREGKAEGDADEAGLRHRLAVVGHAAPHDEASERGRHHREAEPGEQGAHQERLAHVRPSRPACVPWAAGVCGSPARSCR